ncbi:hypothetical protein POM88_051556 [Heracleum sosnowskyi]|uniref:ORC6 second cyclin-like domain-containing protein n=1 Tax=Heracleum sosnowskyi TaxID=360622 RepID=A0AAD8H265_9APIA|nr:hypothetical protein POM88_051556 [Heracleum sosnowskyi]
MSSFIDLVETFDFTNLAYESYCEKIDGLLKRFPVYEKDDRFQTVLPSEFLRTADDYFSIKFCVIGRYPIYGIYNKRDLDLVGVCVEGDVMYALDDCDLHPSFVPDLQLHKLSLGIQYTPLATRETLNYTRKCMCSAISTLSLGYTPQKKNDWCEAIVLLTGMTSQAVRFPVMKYHVAGGLGYRTAHGMEHDGRYMLFANYKALQNRWNKLSRAIRRGEYPYFYSHYNDIGQYSVSSVTDYRPEYYVSLINDKDKTRKQKFRRKLDKWNGPLGNDIRKHEEESIRRNALKRKAKQIALKKDNTVLESMHGFWCGSVDNFKHQVASVKCLPRPAQMFRDSRYLPSATPPLDHLKVVLQVQTNLASTLPVVKNIWNEGGLLALFRGTSMVIENWGPGPFFWLRRSSPNLSMQRAIVDCTGLVFTAAASYTCAKRHKVKVDKIKMQC